MSDKSDDENLDTKQTRIELNIKKKTPRPMSDLQKENIKKALAARAKKIEERKNLKMKQTKDKEQAIGGDVQEESKDEEQENTKDVDITVNDIPNDVINNPKISKERQKKEESEEIKNMRKKLKRIELEEIIQKRVSNAITEYEDLNKTNKEVKRLKKIEEKLLEEKKKNTHKFMNFIGPDGTIL